MRREAQGTSLAFALAILIVIIAIIVVASMIEQSSVDSGPPTMKAYNQCVYDVTWTLQARNTFAVDGFCHKYTGE